MSRKIKDTQVTIDANPASNSNQRPRDVMNLVYIVLLIHGIGTLMPWNMFINAEDYFRNYKLNGVNITDQSANSKESIDNLRGNFLSYLSVCAQVPNVLFNGLNLIVNMGSGNLKLRVNLTLIIEAFIFAITIILAYVDSTQWPITFFYATMASVVILNMASGIYQNCIFGTGAKFPGSYTNAILIGSNFSGTFTSTINLLTIWLAPAPQEAAIYYFVTALLIILVCLISYNLLPLIEFYKYYEQRSMQANKELAQHELIENPRQQQVPGSLDDTVVAMLPKKDGKEKSGKEENSFKGELLKKWNVFLKCWPQCLNVFLIFYVTLAPFPAVLADIGQLSNYFNDKYYVSFACFFIFNFLAMLGNLLSGWTNWPGKERVWILVYARFLFIPFFLFCNYIPSLRSWPILITNDFVYIIGNCLFALSSGYLSSLCMMFASSDLSPEEAPKAGMLAAFFLVFGIFLGVNSSFLLRWIVQIGK